MSGSDLSKDGSSQSLERRRMEIEHTERMAEIAAERNSGGDQFDKWFALFLIVASICVAAVLITNMILNHGHLDFGK